MTNTLVNVMMAGLIFATGYFIGREIESEKRNRAWRKFHKEALEILLKKQEEEGV
jgi:hypothetical protein